MDRGSMVKVSLLVAGVLLIAACGKAPGASIGADRFAVVDWQRAERSHPEYKKLEQGAVRCESESPAPTRPVRAASRCIPSDASPAHAPRASS